MLLPASHQAIDAYWATEMGTGADRWPVAPGVLCQAQQLYSGIQLFLREDTLLIATPPYLVPVIAAQIREVPSRRIFSAAFVEHLRVPGLGKILGPACVSYADPATFQPAPAVSARLLTPGDTAACQSLAAALSPAELDQSGFNPREAPAFGAFAGGLLGAVATCQRWEPRIAQITVATHPGSRRQGHARAAISALAEHAFARNLILQYRALAVNEPSLQLGRSLGFAPYCSMIYARLSPPNPP